MARDDVACGCGIHRSADFAFYFGTGIFDFRYRRVCERVRAIEDYCLVETDVPSVHSTI